MKKNKRKEWNLVQISKAVHHSEEFIFVSDKLASLREKGDLLFRKTALSPHIQPDWSLLQYSDLPQSRQQRGGLPQHCWGSTCHVVFELCGFIKRTRTEDEKVEQLKIHQVIKGNQVWVPEGEIAHNVLT